MAMLNNQMVYQKGNPIDEAAYWNDRGFWTLCIKKGGWSGHGWFIVKFIASMIICDYLWLSKYLCIHLLLSFAYPFASPSISRYFSIFFIVAGAQARRVLEQVGPQYNAAQAGPDSPLRRETVEVVEVVEALNVESSSTMLHIQWFIKIYQIHIHELGDLDCDYHLKCWFNIFNAQDLVICQNHKWWFKQRNNGTELDMPSSIRCAWLEQEYFKLECKLSFIYSL